LRARLARHFHKNEDDNKKESPKHQGSRLAEHYSKLDTDVPLVKRQGTLKEENFERPSTESESQDMEHPIDQE
jgi:hypothetical protein